MTEFQPGALLNAAVYAITGILLFLGACSILVQLAPFNGWKEGAEKGNIAAAVLLGALALGLALIVANTVH